MLSRVALIGWLAIAVVSATQASAGEPDFSAWQRLPVFHSGRMMPVNTFAQQIVEAVCGSANPRLSLDGAAAATRSLPEFREAERLFPGGSRKFPAAELLFSWLVEPERWELVPLLLAEHEGLRKDVLGLPTHSESGIRLKYVSPRAVAESKGFWEALDQLQNKRRQGIGRNVELTATERKLAQLSEAFSTYRALTFDPFRDPPQPFLARLGDAATAWNSAATIWAEAKSGLESLTPAVYDGNIDAQIEAVRSALSSLSEITDRNAPDPIRAELMLASAEREAQKLAESTERGMKEIFSRAAPPEYTAPRWKRLRSQAHLVASRAGELAIAITQAELAIYESHPALRLVPGLNSPALEQDRGTDDQSQPWLSVQTLLFSGNDVYRRFLRPGLPETPPAALYPENRTRLEYLQLLAEKSPHRPERAALAEAAAAYVDRGAAGRAERFEAAMDRFAAELRALAEQIEPYRAGLPLRNRDEALIAATAYPPPGATDAEVRYYRLDPFLWSWVFSFLALCCLGVAFGVLRAPMYWIGVLALVAGQAFSVYGFTLRVCVTGWAPVTNMFETVVFVALVAALLGLWFALAPLFGPAIRHAWRMTAIPGAPGIARNREHDLELMGPAAWTGVRWVLLLPRLALAAAVVYFLAAVSYGSGTGYAIVRMAPRSETWNDRIVWLVGLMMFGLSVWLVPRLALAALLSAVTIPWTLAKAGLGAVLRRTVDRKAFAVAGAGLAFVLGLVAYFAPIWDKGINPLMPVLRDNFWLTVHVLTITASYGAGFLAWALGIAAMGYYLLGRYRDGDPSKGGAARRQGPEACEALSGFIYRSIQVAVVLLAAGTILGGLWADVSWGRFWGWDPKEVWALISLLIYVGVLHFRITGVLRDFSLAAGAVVSITAIVMAWWGVNYFFGSGMHSYGSGEGGGWYVAGFLVVNFVVVAAAAIRYLGETGVSPEPVEAPGEIDRPRAETVPDVQ